MRSSLKVTLLAVFSIVVLGTVAIAVMPPAPAEWYQRLGVPIPDAAKSSITPYNPQIQIDLEEAALKRPKNTDNILVILVQFSDHYADTVAHPPAVYDDMMFSSGVIPTGSLYEYYQEISYGAFAPAGTITAWITAPNPYSYYANDQYGTGEYPNNSQGLLEDCVNILDPTLDFSLFDNNGDGYAEGIFLVHAGPAAEETGNTSDIWSHAWYFDVTTDDGVSTGRYSVEPEEDMVGNLIAIGVFCHEYGHVLGMPDLYDVNGGSEGIGVYCLMAGGSWGALPGNPERPTHMCAEMKRRLEWLTPIVVTADMENLVIPPVETHPVCYRINNPLNSDEHFLIENRAKIGYDSLFRGDGGLAIWHIDYDGHQWEEEHRYVSLEQADGNGDLERDMAGGNRDPRTNRGDAGDLYPGGAGNHRFSFSTYPSSNGYYSDLGIVTIADIQHYADSMTMDILTGSSEPLFNFVSSEIHDTLQSLGPANFNGDADYGETVDLDVKLACDGADVSNLKATLSTSDTRVTIIDDESDYIAASRNTYIENGMMTFRVEITSSDSDSAVSFALFLDADGEMKLIDFRMNINRQKVLLVLDNNGSHWSDNVVKAMHRSGYSFDVYNTYFQGTPALDDLIPYHAVMWTTGSYFGKTTYSSTYGDCLNSDERDVISDYMDYAGRLGLFSQDYMYDVGFNSFNSAYLHTNGAYQDYGADQSLGASGTFMDGFSGTSKATTFLDYSDDLVPASGAAEVLFSNPEGYTLAVSYPAAGPQIGTHASTFCGYGIERFDSTSLDQFLQTWLPWMLGNTNVDIPIPASPKNGDTVYLFTPEYRWSASDGADSYHIQISSNSTFTSIIKDSTVTQNSVIFPDTLGEGSYFWRVSATGGGNPETTFSPAADFSRGYIIIYVCGDADGSESINLLDVTYLINYLYKDGLAPDPLEAGDADAGGTINILDVTYLINYLYKGGPEPLCPE